MQFYEYKGFTIYPAPQFADSSCSWRAELIIRYADSLKKYRTEDIYFTKGEAVFHSILHGKKLIDEGVVLLDEAV